MHGFCHIHLGQAVVEPGPEDLLFPLPQAAEALPEGDLLQPLVLGVPGTIESISAAHKSLNDDVPEKTIVIITTDGMENSSKEYTYSKVKKLIDRQKKKNWEFLFLGANIDVAAEAKRFGISSDRAVKFKCDSQGVQLNYACLDEAVTTIRSGKELNVSWKKNIEADYESRE